MENKNNTKECVQEEESEALFYPITGHFQTISCGISQFPLSFLKKRTELAFIYLY